MINTHIQRLILYATVYVTDACVGGKQNKNEQKPKTEF